MNKQQLSLEMWKTKNYVSTALSFLTFPLLLALWRFDYKIFFWILLGVYLLNGIFLGYQIFKLKEKIKEN